MKRFFVSLVLMLFVTSTYALDECFTGSWFDPKRDGEGINIEVNPGGIVVAYFYSFDKTGRQVWWTLLGQDYLSLLTTVKFDDDDFVTKTVETGTARIEPITDGIIRFEFQHIVLWNPISEELELCTGDTCKGEFVYRRITQPVPCKSET